MENFRQTAFPGNDNKLEVFINEYLKEDLNQYNKHLTILNADIDEYQQLRHIITFMKTNLINTQREDVTNKSLSTTTTTTTSTSTNNTKSAKVDDGPQETTSIGQTKNGCIKTQTNIGGNMFLKTKIVKTDTIFIDVGLNHYVEFTIDEALKFCDFKISISKKRADVIREQSVKTKAQIKLGLLCLGEKMHLYN